MHREVQCIEQISLESSQFWKSPELTTVAEAQEHHRVGCERFEQRAACELALGLTHQVFQQTVDQECNHQYQRQADQTLILVQPQRVDLQRSFEHPEAFLDLVLFFEMAQHVSGREGPAVDQNRIATIPLLNQGESFGIDLVGEHRAASSSPSRRCLANLGRRCHVGPDESVPGCRRGACTLRWFSWLVHLGQAFAAAASAASDAFRRPGGSCRHSGPPASAGAHSARHGSA